MREGFICCCTMIQTSLLVSSHRVSLLRVQGKNSAAAVCKKISAVFSIACGFKNGPNTETRLNMQSLFFACLVAESAVVSTQGKLEVHISTLQRSSERRRASLSGPHIPLVLILPNQNARL